MKIIKYLGYVVLLAAIGFGGYYGWRFYNKAKEPVLDALYILPNDAAIIFAFNDYRKFNEQLESDNEVWKDIRNTYGLQEKKETIDSILSKISNMKTFSGLMNKPGTRLYLSFHFIGKGRFTPVYSISLPSMIDIDNLREVLKKDYYVEERKFSSSEIYKISSKKGKQIYYMSQLRGVFTLTAYEPLAEKIVLSAEAVDPVKQKLKYRMLKMSGKDIPTNVYVNYRYLYRLISKYSAKHYRPLLMSLSNLSQAAEFDMKVEKNKLIFSGFSIQNDSFPSFLASYLGYQPVLVRASNILPANTSFMFYQGAEKLPELLQKRAKGSFSERDEEMLQRYKAKYLVDVGDYFYSWMRNELVFALSQTNSSDFNQGAYTLIEAMDIKEAAQMLKRLANTVNEKKNIVADTNLRRYRGYEIHSIELANLLPALFGKMFAAMEHTYYTFIDTYVVFANSEQSLESIIDNYMVERVLQNNEVYQDVMLDMGEENNVLLYANLNYLRPHLKHFLSNEGVDVLEHSGMAFENFGSFALEYVNNGRDIYTSLVLRHGAKQEIDEPIAWKTALDNPVARGPFAIKNHRSGKQEILVFDKTKLMYRIDQTGSIAWAVPVLEYPMSKVYMVDYYKNGKYQYMFNSKNYLYLYDLNGNRVENYPVKLPFEATAPMTVVDYDNNKNYRILIPLADGKVHNFKIDGTETPGWKNPGMKAPVFNAVQFFKLGTKDFLLIADTAGNVIYANRRGEPRMDVALAFTNNPRTTFYKSTAGGKPKIITTDMVGRIVNVDAEGNVEKKLLHEFSSNHVFYYFDFDGDNHKDYVFIDGAKFYVYNSKGEMIVFKEFMHNIEPDIVKVDMATKENIKVILRDAVDFHLILITQAGEALEKEDLSSQTKCVKEEATKSEILRLIGATGRIVSSFLIN